ncbi:hypothetical protein GCM10022405_07010 [Gibbsiella dentisursi]|uniref:Uncharacterized protein n=1 Tax=Gibbsiella dentisursi TaxID=796890 RepID=A0ABP7KP00_9GAMM
MGVPKALIPAFSLGEKERRGWWGWCGTNTETLGYSLSLGERVRVRGYPSPS